MPKSRKRPPVKPETKAAAETLPEIDTTESADIAAAAEQTPEIPDTETLAAADSGKASQNEDIEKEELSPEPETEISESPVAAVDAQAGSMGDPETIPGKILHRLQIFFKEFAKGFQKRCFADNAVLIRVLAICTVLAATTSLKNGILLGIAAVFVTVPLYFIAALLCRFLPKLWQRPLTLLTAGAIVTPVCMLAAHFAPEVTLSVGIFLPLTALNAALMAEMKPCSKKDVTRILVNGFGDSLGFALVVLAASLIREIIGAGTLYGRPLPVFSHIKFNFALLPPGALLLLGLMFAVVQGVQAHRASRKKGS